MSGSIFTPLRGERHSNKYSSKIRISVVDCEIRARHLLRERWPEERSLLRGKSQWALRRVTKSCVKVLMGPRSDNDRWFCAVHAPQNTLYFATFDEHASLIDKRAFCSLGNGIRLFRAFCKRTVNLRGWFCYLSCFCHLLEAEWSDWERSITILTLLNLD